MLRLINEHAVRQVGSLDGLWDFVPQPERTDRKRLPGTYSRKVHVPSCWESLPGLETYRGCAWFHREVEASTDKALRLVFGGVSHTGTVFVDGKEVGEHYDAYGAWDVVVPPGRKQSRDVVVRVDNTLSDASVLHRTDDYYTYGGIIRPVEVHQVPEVFVDKLFAAPSMGKTGKWSLDVRVRLRNWSSKPLRRSLTISVAGQTKRIPAVTVRSQSSTETSIRLTGLTVDPWNVETPTLYSIEARLYDDDNLVDDLIDRIGFRQVKTGKGKIWLNKTPIRLWGYNRHEDHPNFGCALPLELMMQDLALLGDLGCNFVRTSHYPNDMRFLDLCDQLGFYVWTESHSKTVNLKNKRFREQIRNATTDMVDWQYNHACIIIWSALNECDDQSAHGLRQHAWTMDLLRKLDPTRPVTYAQFAGAPAGYSLVDIVSYNTYPGWYFGGPITPLLAKGTADGLVENVRKCKLPGVKDKPVIFSEFGGGAFRGFDEPRRPKWGENYQSDILDMTLQEFMNHPEIAGVAIWQFCDVRASADTIIPREMNNKGTVDAYRIPKRAYQTVKKHMTAKKAANAKQ